MRRLNSYPHFQPARILEFAPIKGRQRTVERVAKATAILVFLTPFDGFYWLSYALGFSLTAVVGYLVFASSLNRVHAIIQSQPHVFWLWFLTFLIGTLIALGTSLANDTSVDVDVRSIWQMIVLWALVTYASRFREEGDLVINSFVGGLVLSMVTYVVLYVIGFEVKEFSDRVSAVAGFQTNHAGFTAAVGLLLLLGRYKHRSWRTLLLTTSGLVACIAVLLLSNSRGAFLSLAVGLLTFLLPGSRQARFMKARLVVFVLGAVGILFLSFGAERSGELFARVEGRWSHSTTVSDLTGKRSDIFATGLEISAEHPLGVGIGNAKFLLANRTPAFVRGSDKFLFIDTHNEYLRVLLESGYQGLSIYLLGCVILIVTALRARFQAGLTWPLAVLLCILTFFMGAGAGYTKITWIGFGLIAGQASQVAILTERRFNRAKRARDNVPGFT